MNLPNILNRVSFWSQRILLFGSIFLLTVTFSVSVFAQGRNLQLTPKDLHGGIEIGPRAIQAIALRIGLDRDGNYDVKMVYAETLLPALPRIQDGKLAPESTRELGNSVQKLWRRLLEYRVPPEQIYLFANANFRIATNLQDLAAEVRTRTGKAMEILDTESEVQLTISGTIPRRLTEGNRSYDNRSISALVEIVGNDIKGGYQQTRLTPFGQPTYDFVTFNIPKGIHNFAADIGKGIPANADLATFAKQAQALSESGIRAPLRTELASRIGMTTRRKIYLNGSVMTALVYTLYPGDRRTYVPITVADINTFYNRLLTNPDALLNPDLSKITDLEWRRNVEEQLEAIRTGLTTKAMISGAEILRSIAAEMNFQNKQLVFSRYWNYSRMLSYVRLQPEQ